MKTISEVWVKGKLISREEHDDGIQSLEEIEKRLAAIEYKMKK